MGYRKLGNEPVPYTKAGVKDHYLDALRELAGFVKFQGLTQTPRIPQFKALSLDRVPPS